MKTMKRVISTALLLCMLAALMSVSAFADGDTFVLSTVGNDTELQQGAGEHIEFRATLSREAGKSLTGHHVHWYVNDIEVAMVPTSSGVSSLTLYEVDFDRTENVVKAEIDLEGNFMRDVKTISVRSAPAVEHFISLDMTDATTTTGNPVQLQANVDGALDNSLASWVSSNTNVAVVNNQGYVTPVKGGTATITATSKLDLTKSATCLISVVDVSQTTVTIAPVVNQLTKNQTINISASVSSGTARFDHWRVDSNMASYITLANDASPNTTLTARATTNVPVRLYAYADDGAYSYVEFTIIAADKLDIEAYPAYIYKGESSSVYVTNSIPGEEFIWTITPSAQYGVLASSSNRGNAVDLTAGSVEGRVVVTATSRNDTSRSDSVTVYINSEASYGTARIVPDVATWSSGKLSFEVYPAYYKAYIDGKLLTPQSGYYTYYNNMLTLNPSLLATLSNGEHSLKVYTASSGGMDGLVYATIYVNKAATASSVYGDNAHVRGSSYNLYFTSTDPIKDVYISNQWIDPANYSIDPTGKYLTLNSNFLNQLGYGSYTMKLATQNGYTETANFRIVTANYAPATGDDSNIGAWMLLLTVSCAGAVALIPKRKKSTDLM